MAGRIYLLNGESKLTAMDEAAYDSEKILQELLGSYPDLLAGEQIDSRDPRRWLLVTREMGVPGEEDGANRWSLDHLFLDQDAVSTLVEVKRSSDTRIRREVVGQMLDYAANAVAYWPVEEIRAKFEKRCETLGEDAEQVLSEFTEDEQDAADFWQKAKTNLQAGRIRMVFVADEIPAELRRIIEFLNEQMDPAEVLGVEIRQFVGQGLKSLVPRVVGQTETAIRKKQPTGKRESVSAEQFWQVFRAQRSEPEVRAAEQIVESSRKAGLTDNFKQGDKGTVFIPILSHDNRKFYPFALNSNGTVAIQMRWLKVHPPFDTEEGREQLHQKLSQFDGFLLGEKGMLGIPKVPIASITDSNKCADFTTTLDWIVSELQQHAQVGGSDRE